MSTKLRFAGKAHFTYPKQGDGRREAEVSVEVEVIDPDGAEGGVYVNGNPLGSALCWRDESGSYNGPFERVGEPKPSALMSVTSPVIVDGKFTANFQVQPYDSAHGDQTAIGKIVATAVV